MGKNGFKKLGIMLDCSRNAVMRVEEVENMIDNMRAMGYNTLMLYTEDTYEVNNRPYFGYLRGRYSKEELKRIDAYAAENGIELMPCIQTLAHVNALMRWPEFIEMRDCEDILCVGDEKVYSLLEDIFSTLSETFTSRTVNIGMDEAYLMGRGRYMDINGVKDRTEILLTHLNRVSEIAAKYGFELLMWSDMFFRLATGSHYGDGEIPPEINDMIPKNVKLIYWEYGQHGKSYFDSLIKRHQAISSDIWFAGGVQSWTGFAPHSTYAVEAMRTAAQSALDNGVESFLLTVWGDDGAECSKFSVLPTMYAVSRFAAGEFDTDKIKAGFEDTFGIEFDKFMLLELPGTANAEGLCNPDKYMLYSDLLLGVWDSTVREGDAARYAECAEKLAEISESFKYSYIFRTQRALCEVLALKLELGLKIRNAYLSQNTEELKALAGDCGILAEKLEIFYNAFENQWMTENKPHGFDVQDIRIGGLIKRVAHAKARIEKYINGELVRIEELEEPLMEVFGRGFGYTPAPVRKNDWKNIVSANVI